MAQTRCSRRRQPSTGIGEPVLKDLLEGKPLRHPIHPMLVHFPIGFLVLSFLLDLVSLVFPDVPGLLGGSFYAMLLGIIAALLAAVPGIVDYSEIRRDHPGKVVATRHMILNLMVVAIYGINLWIRSSALSDPKISLLPFLLSIIGIGLLSVSGYLGGRLVYDEGIAVGRHKRRTPTPQETIRLSTGHATKDGETTFVPIPEAEQLGNGETLRVEIDKLVMTIARIDNQLYAFQEFCTHRFGPLSEGSLHGFNVQCPWHNSCFDVRTGKVTNGPAKVDLKTFKIEKRDGKVGVLVTKDHDQKT
ncbi:MAG: hypothetical protein DMF14_02975 [Verrucomicrobia bacterium]|nr:MAG: hypothetical protein DMF14_02975 [Verrucomicrobiota bacterium]